MPIWNARPVDQVPAIKLSRWAVAQLPDGDRHFVGWNRTEGEGRTSSRIVAFDEASRTGTTNSGRRYMLVGPPASEVRDFDGDADYTFGVWCHINSVDPASVGWVTSDYATQPAHDDRAPAE
ncbi:MAG: hypothetical protein U0904_03970 [Candidatus Nanopelagicales bacterium]|nr:hypothetical protein [Candidatus Nanopelagicales bacterium]